MFTNIYAFMAVDAIQDAKKNAVATLVKHEGVRNALTDFVEAQRAYTKSAITAGMLAVTTIGGIVMSKTFLEELTKGKK